MEEELISVFTSITDENDMKKLFSEVFTEAENKDFILRWQLLNDLYKQIPQRTIASKLKISLCKITRGSKILKNKDGIVKKILSQKYDDHIHI